MEGENENETDAMRSLRDLTEDMRSSASFDEEDVACAESVMERLRTHNDRARKERDALRASLATLRRTLRERNEVIKRHESKIDFSSSDFAELGTHLQDKQTQLESIASKLMERVSSFSLDTK